MVTHGEDDPGNAIEKPGRFDMAIAHLAVGDVARPYQDESLINLAALPAFSCRGRTLGIR